MSLKFVLLLLLPLKCIALQNLSRTENESTFHLFGLPHKSAFVELLNKLAYSKITMSPICRRSLVNFAQGLRENEVNSLLMFDSFAKMRPGLFSYRFTDFGHYEQCLHQTRPQARYVVLEVDVNSNDTKFYLNPIGRRHFAFQKPLIAICIPGVCSEDDVTNMLNSQSVSSIMHPYKLRVFTSELPGEEQFADHKTLRTASCTILMLVVLLSLVCTSLIALYP